MAEIKFRGNPIHTAGTLPAVGSKAPDFKLTKTDLGDVSLKDYAGKTVVLNTDCDELAAGLKSWGYQTIAVELDEFLKAGGSAKCLTLRLDGEEAAVWQ